MIFVRISVANKALSLSLSLSLSLQIFRATVDGNNRQRLLYLPAVNVALLVSYFQGCNGAEFTGNSLQTVTFISTDTYV